MSKIIKDKLVVKKGESLQDITFNDHLWIYANSFLSDDDVIRGGGTLEIFETSDFTNLANTINEYLHDLYYDGTNVWITSDSPNAVNLYDPITYVPIRTISVDDPVIHIYEADNHIWFDNTETNIITVIDKTTYEVLSTINISGISACLTYDGENIWVSSYNLSQQLYIISNIDYSIVGSINFVDITAFTGCIPYKLTFDGDKIWMLAQNAMGSVYPSDYTLIINKDTFAIMYTISLQFTNICYDGRYIWVTNWDSTYVTVLNKNTYLPVATIIINTVSVSPTIIYYDNEFIWILSFHNDWVIKINPTTYTVLLSFQMRENNQPLSIIRTQGSYVNPYTEERNITKGEIFSNLITNASLASPELTTAYGIKKVEGKDLLLGNYPTEVWFGDYNNSSIKFINTQLSILSPSITVNANPNSIAFDGRYFWVLNTGVESITVIDSITRASVAFFIAPSTVKQLFFDGTYMWLTHGNAAGNISIWNTNVYGMLTFITIGTPLEGICYGNGYIWVTCVSSQFVVAINPSTFAKYATITVGTNPKGIIYDGSRYIWVANSASANITRIDTTTNPPITVQIIGVSDNPSYMCNDGSHIWVLKPSANIVSIYSLLTRNEIAHPTVPSGVNSLCFDGDYIWVTSTSSNYITKFTTLTFFKSSVFCGVSATGICSNKNIFFTRDYSQLPVIKTKNKFSITLSTVSVYGSPKDICYDGQFIWINDVKTNTVKKIDASTKNILKTITCHLSPPSTVTPIYNPRGICLARNSLGTEFIYVCDYTDSRVFKIDKISGDVLTYIYVTDGPNSVCFDGANIWVGCIGSATGALIKINVNTDIKVEIITISSGVRDICYDGTNIWISCMNSIQSKVIQYNTISKVSYDALGINGIEGICFDGINIWTANRYTINLLKIDAATGTSYTYLNSIAFKATGIVFTGDSIYIAGERNSGLLKVDINTNVQTYIDNVVPLGTYSLCFDGLHIWALDYDGNVTKYLP